MCNNFTHNMDINVSIILDRPRLTSQCKKFAQDFAVVETNESRFRFILHNSGD